MVLGACGGGSDDSDSGDSGGDASTEGPKSQAGAGADESEGATAGGVLRIGMEAESDGLNPTTNRFAVAGLQMGNAVFDTLAASDEDGNPVPYLAESFTPNADFTEWTVTLRPNVKFHDGTALTAEAIVANITAQANDALVGRAVKPVLAETDFVAATGELTAVVRMRQPSAHFPSYLTGQLGMVASPTWLEAAKANPDLNQKPVGKHQVWVCRTLPCALRGGVDVLHHCERRLGIHAGETTADGKITLRSAECLASCGTAPMMQVDKNYYENLTPEAVDRILDQLTK
jgi:ABC-type transport system substrate-binding protein